MKNLKKFIACVVVAVLFITTMPFSALRAQAVTALTYDSISLNNEVTVDTTKTFEFIPTESGTYKFYSFDDGGLDTYGHVYDSEFTELAYNDDDGDANNFCVVYSFTAGETYYLMARPCGEDTGTYKVIVEEADPAQSVEIRDYYHCRYGLPNMTKQLEIDFYPYGCATESVLWTSNNEQVATVDDNGLVSLLSAGTATITVTSENGLSDTFDITVKDCFATLTTEQPVELSSLFESESVFLKFVPAESAQYRIYSTEISNERDTAFYMFDSSMNELVFVENSFDFDYAFQAEETYYIQVFFDSYSDCEYNSCQINAVKLMPATGVSITADSTSGYVGDWLRFGVEFAPENSISESVTWTSSNPAVADFDEWDDLELISAGTTTITATSENGLTDSITITVNETPSISLGEEKTVNDKATFKFVPTESGTYAFYSYDNGYTDTYADIYDSEFSHLYSNDDGGADMNFRVVCTLEEGETYYLKANNFDDEGTYKVAIIKLEAATSISIVADSTSGYVGEWLYFTARFTPENAIPENITWTSSNPAVADFDEWDNLVLLSAGTTTITATSENGLTDSITVTVNEITEITVDTDYTVTIGDEYSTDFKYKFTPTKDGVYEFESDGGIYVIFDENDVHIDSYRWSATAGETYYIIAIFEGYSEGDYTFSLIRRPAVTDVEIISLPDQMDWVEGYVDSDYSGLKIKLTFDDNTTAQVTYNGNNPYYSVYYIDVYNEYGDDDSYVKTYVECGNASDSFSFNIIEDPVSSIELVSGSVSLIENYDGEDYGDYYNYYYNVPEDVTIKINYKNGTHKTVNIYDVVDGYGFSWEDDQYENHWTVGGENYITVDYHGHTTQLPVIINKNPVDHIVINTAPTREYIYGDEHYGGVDGENGEYYYLYPADFTGISFTVYYTDNTSKTFTYDEVSEDNYIGDYYCFAWLADEYAVLGENTVIFSYLGKTATYNVTVKESPVSSIELINPPSVSCYEWSYEPDLSGAKFKITYKDNSSKEVTLTQENTSWGVEGYYYVDIDGYYMRIYAYGGSENVEKYAVSYLGANTSFEIGRTDSKRIKSVSLSNVTIDGDGMIINITYADNTSETLTFSAIGSYQGGMLSYDLKGKTEKGYLSCYLELMSKDSKQCYVYILDEEVYAVLVCDEGEHQYDNSADKTCNICGAEREIYNGWTKIDGKWYYYENGNAVKNAWRKDSTGWVYLGADGAMVKSKWVLSGNGKWYYCDANGYMVTNKWMKDSKGWVYLGADGAMVTNKWVKDSKGWCYVGANGYAVTNQWKKDSHGWIYLDANGSMIKSKWVLSSGKWYYCDANGYMVSNKWMKDSKGWVYLGSDGAMVVNKWVKDSKGWCYVGSNGYAVTNQWKKDSHGWIYLDSNGSMTKSKWVLSSGKWYYCDANGYMVANKSLKIGKKTYNFNASGVCTNP